jgi:hypothetical protein
MYGQFQNAQSFQNQRTKHAEKNIFTKTYSGKRTFTFASIIILLLVASTLVHAGPSRPTLPGGNGNTQGR